MSTVEWVRIGAAIPQVFIDGPVDMTWVRDWIQRSEALGFDRNTNTGDIIAEDASFKPALQTILHDAQHPSHVTLPIVPR